FTDAYGYELSTASGQAAEHFVDASDRWAAFESGIGSAIDGALSFDPDFALAHALRAMWLRADMNFPGAVEEMRTAQELVERATRREQSAVSVLGLWSDGSIDRALTAAADHLARWP